VECPACFVPVTKRHTGTLKGMARGKRYQAEQVVNLLRQIEVAVANGKTTAQASREADIVEQMYFRWRKEYGGLKVDQAKRLKELEHENAKLKRLVAELILDKLVLKDIKRNLVAINCIAKIEVWTFTP
jgi:putative transposase